MLLIPITIKGEKMYCTRTSVTGAFLCPENKAQIEKTGKEVFDAAGMKLYYSEN